jgi:hypothetical protein
MPPPTEVGGGQVVEACRLDKEFTMKPMKLADVRKHTGRELTYAEAVKLVNPGPFLRNMAVALSLHTWNNTPQDWLRLEAALVIIHHRPRRNCR